MRKYFEVAKTLFKAQLAYRFDVCMSVLVTVSKILFAFILWGAIFGENETVSGFTFPMMLSYYIISSFLAQIEMSAGVSREIGDRIRGGTFSKYMVVPVNVNGYFVAQTLGAMSFYLLFALLGTALWAVLFPVQFVLTSDPALLLSGIGLVVLGLLFMIQFNYLLGLLAFKFQDISFFLMIKDNLVEFITGGLIPLALLPTGILSAMRFFPFYYVTYLPSMLFIGENGGEAVTGLLVLGSWLLALLVINRITYGKMRKIYDGVGI